MAFGSKIDSSKINADYPKQKQVNPVQGFRDNFAAIAENFSHAAIEITRIQNKSIKVDGDVSGSSTLVADSDDPIRVNLTLRDSGVVAGVYDAPRITVDKKGRITAVHDGSEVFVKQTGGIINGDLTLKNASIHIDAGQKVAGRDLVADGTLLDQLNARNGILVRQANGQFAARQIEATDGLKIINADGVKGAMTLGVAGFSLTFQGDVKGNARFKGLHDAVINLRLDTTNVLSPKGGKMLGTLDLNDNYIKGVKAPIYGTHVGDRDYNDARYIRNTLGGASGFVVQRRPGTETAPREIKGIGGVIVKFGDGFDGNPEVSVKDFKISLSGDVRGSGVVAGLKDVVIKTQLPNYYTKEECDHLFLNKREDSIQGDFVVRGNIKFPDGGTVDGRNLRDDGTVIDALKATGGFAVNNMGEWVGRVLQSEDYQITIHNGDGMLGNPTFGLASNITLPGRGGMRVPMGATSERLEPTPGFIRFNTDRERFEVCTTTAWNDVLTVTYGELPSDTATVWSMSRSRSMTLVLDKDVCLSAEGFSAGQTYVLYCHQDDAGNHALTFGDMFKFPADFIGVGTNPNQVDVIEFHCDGKYLYGVARHNFISMGA